MSEKAQLREKLLGFYDILNRIRGEIDQEFGQIDCLMDNCKKFSIMMSEEEKKRMKTNHSNFIDHFSKKFSQTTKFLDEYPFRCLDLLSGNQKHKQEAATSIVQYFENPDPLFRKFNDIFDDEDRMQILKQISSNASFDFSSSPLYTDLVKVFRILPFTNCFSERVFSIQHYIHSQKRAITPQTLSEYMYLFMNKTSIPDTSAELYYQEYSKILNGKKDEDEEDETGRKISFECFEIVENLKTGEDMYSESLRKLLDIEGFEVGGYWFKQ